MRTVKFFGMVVLFILTVTNSNAQKKMNTEIFESLPQSLELKDEVQKYQVVTNHINGKLDLAGQGTFENKNMLFTWTGISEMNGELCALIEYRTFNNPLEFSSEETEMKGLSHYWENIWVSLEDKQIEYATMLEIVSAEMSFPGQTNKQVMTITREIEVKKLL